MEMSKMCLLLCQVNISNNDPEEGYMRQRCLLEGMTSKDWVLGSGSAARSGSSQWHVVSQYKCYLSLPLPERVQKLQEKITSTPQNSSNKKATPSPKRKRIPLKQLREFYSSSDSDMDRKPTTCTWSQSKRILHDVPTAPIKVLFL